LPLRTLLPIATGLIASALLLPPATCRASALTSVNINGVSDDDTQSVTSTATVMTLGPGAVGTASADADLATGTLRAKTEGDADDVLGFLDADASSELGDVLFLTPDPDSPTSPVPFTLFMDLEGILLVDGSGTASPNLQAGSARVVAGLQIEGLAVSGVAPAALTVTRRVQASGGNVLDDSTTVDLQQNTTGIAEDATLDVRLTATAMVTPNSAFSIRAFIVASSDADAAFSSVCDLFQTGQLGVIVPDGYSLSSSTGSFLTVPEPGASASFAPVGVALVAVVRRRARR
jgi:hypothetical protein